MNNDLRILKRLIHPWSSLLLSCSIQLSRNRSNIRERVLSIRLHLQLRCQQPLSIFWKQQYKPIKNSQLMLWNCNQRHLRWNRSIGSSDFMLSSFYLNFYWFLLKLYIYKADKKWTSKKRYSKIINSFNFHS